MNSLKEKIVDISTLIEKQLPSFVAENNPKFISFLSSYYESQEIKYGYLDVIKNFIEYYNIGYYSPSKLTELTTLISNISDSSTTLTVSSTVGFPEKNGYISIGDEFIFYKSKTKTQFLECVRGTGTFILEGTPYNQITYQNGSAPSSHVAGAAVRNIGYSFAIEFLRRIKSEISPTLPENLVSELNISSFLKNIKSFYLSKGSESSHQILFRILFNDKKIKLRLKNSGTGANIQILNYNGNINSYQLVSGGSNYYYEVDQNQNLVSPPVIDVIGSGSGVLNQLNQVPNSAQMVVTGMNSSGTITSVQVVNEGQNYIGPITARVRSRSFFQGQKVTNQNSAGITTGSAIVDSWDSSTDELVLTDIVGYFRVDDKIIGAGGENPRSIIAKAYPTTDINREGNPSIETISQDPLVEYPKNHLIRPSSASFYEKKIIRCELLPDYSTVKNLDNVTFIELVQSRDLTNKIPGTSLDITEISRIKDNVYEFEIDKKINYRKLYLPSSTKTTQSTVVTGSSNSTITVNSTFNFPHKKGRLFVGNKVIQYETKTDTQFVNCILVSQGSLNISSNENVYLYGRECLTSGEVSYFIKGYINGDRTLPPILFRLHAVPSKPVISDNGALYKTNTFELDPETTYKVNKTTLISKKYNYGEINDVIIENPGINYKVNDKLIISSQGDLGSGFNAQISTVVGKQIAAYQLLTITERPCIKFTTASAHTLSVGDYVKFNNTLDKQIVYKVISSTEFAIQNLNSLSSLNITGLVYITNSKTASGPIDTITITNKGKNYNKLPEVVGFNTQNGYGALVQLNSDNIGSLTNFQYSSIGSELIGNKTTQYPVTISSTAKIVDNFQIARIEVVQGGNNYNSTTDIVKVNGVINPNCEFKVITSSGVITEIQVLKGGFNFTAIPEITVQSSFGVGGVFKAIIKRKLLDTNDVLTFGSVGSGVTCKVVNFDVPSSTLEYYPIAGTIDENDAIYTKDGNIYGNIISIRKSSAYCKLSAYASYSTRFLDNFGFISDSTQKIIDSDYHQDWSYTLVSQRNTSEWKDQVLENTHTSGYKVFGKNRLENAKQFFERQEDVFNSSVIFKTTLSNSVNSKLSVSDNNKIFTEYVESNSVRNFRSLYEITKKLLDGTVYSNDNLVYGFDTKFTYTYPEYSSSYVEVLNTIPFNGSLKTFTLKYNNGDAYTPVNGKNNLVVYINDNVLSPTEYNISGNQIQFLRQQAYLSTDKCTIIDFTSKYKINNLTNSGANLDSLNVVQNGSRTRFNLSDRGVPQYIKNVGDVFTIKNGLLLRPDSRTYTIPADTNKINFVSAPNSVDQIKLLQFIRQISPEYTKNVLLDDFSDFDGVTTDFPLTLNGVLFSPVDVYNLFIVKNGVHQKPGIDYVIVNDNYVRFTTAPEPDDLEVAFYSYNGFNQNFAIDSFNFFDSQTSRYALTKNLVSTEVESASHLFVFRNEVYQYPGIDYTLQSGPSINFTSNPTQQEIDHIRIVNFKNSSDFVDVTSRFTRELQDDVYTLSYNPTTPSINTNVFLIYLNGILQDTDAWTFNPVTNKLVFDEFVSLQFDKLKIFAFANQKRSLDSFTVSGGVSTYNLSVGGVQISSNYPTSSADLVVNINGIVQDPLTAYTVTNNTITLNNAVNGDTVYIYQVGNSTYPVEILDYLDSNEIIDYTGTNYIYKLTSNYESVNPVSSSDLLVLRNGVIQEAGVNYTTGNGFITFTDNIQAGEDLFIMYAHGTNKISVSSVAVDNQTITLSTPIDPSEYKNLILYINGVSQFHNIDFTMVNSTTAELIDMELDPDGDIFILQYAPITFLDFLNDVQNGSKQRFKLLYDQENLNAPDIVTYADILVSVNGVVQYPGIDYVLNTSRTFIDFTTPPANTDEVFLVRMSGNQLVTLTNESGSTYNLNQSISPADRENFIVFSNNTFKFYELNDFTFVNNSKLTLTSAQTSGQLFAIKFSGITKLLDEINTPFNGTNIKFNLFYDEENYMPNGTVSDYNTPSESSLLVFKNGKLLDSQTDYTLQGDIKSQIQFTVAPGSSDSIFVKSVGAFNKITNIVPNGTKVYNLTVNGNNYYPNSTIERPRDYENQIIVAKDGVVQSPLYDYYIENNKLKFNSNATGSKITVLDFMGSADDVNVDSRKNQFEPKDIIFINGEENEREVDQIISPTVLSTKEIIKNGNLISGNTYIVRELDGSATNLKVGDSFTATSKTRSGIKTCLSTQQTLEGKVASGFVGQSTIQNGVLTGISVVNPGQGYAHPVILRTLGSGAGAKATASVDKYNSYGIINPVVQYAGYNLITGISQEVIPTSYIYVYKESVLDTSTVRKGTILTSNINNSVETIPVGNTQSFDKNSPIVSVTYKTAPTEEASFRPFVSKGRIRKVEVLNGGSGYDDRNAQIQITGGGGSGCVLELVLNSSGTVTNVIVRNAGEGYDTNRVIIENEIIEYTDYTSTQLLGCTRGANASSHNQNTIVYFDKFI
jgi:hypothetical protein